MLRRTLAVTLLNLTLACSSDSDDTGDSPDDVTGAGGMAGASAGGSAGSSGGAAGDSAGGTANGAAAGSASGGAAGSAAGGSAGAVAADTWNNFAAEWFSTYCVECHTTNVSNRDYSTIDDVIRDVDLIRCGVATTQLDGCGDWPPPSQFPIGDGPVPDDEARSRLVAWLEAGTPE